MSESARAQRERLRAAVAGESSDGQRVARDPCNNPVCSMTFNPATRCIDIVWKMYATSLQIRYIHECMLDLIRTHRAVRILGDDTSLGVIHADDEAWIANDWFPRAIAAGIAKGASKSPQAWFARQSVRRIQASAPSGVSLESFQDLGAAQAWLLSSCCPSSPTS
jgi:hypothetical protein